MDHDWELAISALGKAIVDFEDQADRLGVYMPSLATHLRIYADEFADKYPDDTNGGMPSELRK